MAQLKLFVNASHTPCYMLAPIDGDYLISRPPCPGRIIMLLDFVYRAIAADNTVW